MRTSTGDIVEERRCPTNDLGRWLSKRAPGRVIVETCTEAFRVADGARQSGHEVRVVAATLVRALGVGQRGLKNDVRDARLLSEASCRMELPSVHIPSGVSREKRELNGQFVRPGIDAARTSRSPRGAQAGGNPALGTWDPASLA